jgi:hypothetical protein
VHENATKWKILFPNFWTGKAKKKISAECKLAMSAFLCISLCDVSPETWKIHFKVEHGKNFEVIKDNSCYIKKKNVNEKFCHDLHNSRFSFPLVSWKSVAGYYSFELLHWFSIFSEFMWASSVFFLPFCELVQKLKSIQKFNSLSHCHALNSIFPPFPQCISSGLWFLSVCIESVTQIEIEIGCNSSFTKINRRCITFVD